MIFIRSLLLEHKDMIWLWKDSKGMGPQRHIKFILVILTGTSYGFQPLKKVGSGGGGGGGVL